MVGDRVRIDARVALATMIGARAAERGGGATVTVARAVVTLAPLAPCRVPRAGYATALRSATAGEGTFSMEFAQFAPLTAVAQAQLLSPLGR